MSAPLEQRQLLRQSSLAKRDAMPEDMRRTLSAAISSQLSTLLAEAGAGFIHCYISFRSEVQTREFIEEELGRGVRVVVPVVEELDGEKLLIHAEIQHLTNLRKGAFGLEEPVERREADLTGLSAVILPIAAFDGLGNRLGYGRGFYDRFLKTVPRSVQRIGLAFDCQEVPAIPAESHDEGLDIVITESGLRIINP